MEIRSEFFKTKKSAKKYAKTRNGEIYKKGGLVFEQEREKLDYGKKFDEFYNYVVIWDHSKRTEEEKKWDKFFELANKNTNEALFSKDLFEMVQDSAKRARERDKEELAKVSNDDILLEMCKNTKGEEGKYSSSQGHRVRLLAEVLEERNVIVSSKDFYDKWDAEHGLMVHINKSLEKNKTI